ncbi:hypothetical protein [Viscerimonas tarda]
MANLSNIEQARHNESVCNYIGKKPDYSDWVVTTAFYSAIHYVRHLILPLSEGGLTYTTFEALFTRKKQNQEGRHGFQSRLVVEMFPEIRYEYERLHDMSTNARYLNYSYVREEATLAKVYLLKIKEYTQSRKTD